ncbi:acetyl-CoA hydrolase/transferase family protein [Aureivirga marina]|uniref:acetyl-CoA hydrolase/transferase family protein n=1 Tax=Aureivirga marina TaxID=1182451 RepID=UPI0018C94FC2|nr:acetyl-CoA hydrolase/transferase family protein [Aureivirga marina]
MTLDPFKFDKQGVLEIYNQKLTTATNAIKVISPDVKFVTFGCYAATPPTLMRTFLEIVKTDYFKNPVRIYVFRSADNLVNLFNDIELLKRLRITTPFIGKPMRDVLNTAYENKKGVFLPDFVATHFSEIGKSFLNQHGKPDVHMLQVSPMDEHGYFSFGIDGSFSIDSARIAEKVIVEVNSNFPRTFGDGILHVSQVDAIIENTSNLLKSKEREISEESKIIGKIIAEQIPDKACIQLGVGDVPDAVGLFLEAKNDLGIHTELLTSSQVKLILNGNVTNKYKNLNKYHTVFNVAMLPSQIYYNVLDNNPSMLCYPGSYVNNPSVISKIDQMISINSFVEIDLYGQVASESIHWQEITATGGQVDFIRGAKNSNGGKSFLAAHSTTKNGTVSKIVPRLNNFVSTLRTDVHHVVTEYGCVDLSGLSSKGRARALISIAHPNHRESLEQAAKELNLM